MEAAPAHLLLRRSAANFSASLKPHSKALQGLPPDIIEAFADFEAGMAELTRRVPGQRAAVLRDMAVFFLRFDPLPGNLYRQLISVLRSRGEDAVFATLNYDMLIELAATDEGYATIQYQNLPNPTNFRLLKLHGSPNFIPNLGGSILSGINWGDSARHVSAPVMPVTWPDAKKIWAIEDSLAPAMSLYSKGKEVLFSDGFVEKQQRAWTQLCASASEITIIGIRVWPTDTHVWEPLARAAGSLNYVGPDGAEFLNWACCRNGESAVLASSFEDFVAQKLR